jgi:hypothetical protein
MKHKEPEEGSYWLHKKSGNYYQVIVVANTSELNKKPEEYPPSITYKRLIDGSIWERRLSRWYESYEPANTSCEEFKNQIGNIIYEHLNKWKVYYGDIVKH